MLLFRSKINQLIEWFEETISQSMFMRIHVVSFCNFDSRNATSKSSWSKSNIRCISILSWRSSFESKLLKLMLRSFFIVMYKNLWCFEFDRFVDFLHERKTVQQSNFQSLITSSVFATELWSEKEENLQRWWQTKSHKKMKASKKIKTKVNERSKRKRDERWEMKKMKQWFSI